MSELRFVCDGPPSHESGRFVEVENDYGESIKAGKWRERPDGLWELVVTEIPRALGRRNCPSCHGYGWTTPNGSHPVYPWQGRAHETSIACPECAAARQTQKANRG